MNLSFIKVRPTQSVNASRIIQALLLPIVTPDTLGYTLDEGVWRDDDGHSFVPLNHQSVAVAIADESYIDGLKVEYKLPQGNSRYTTTTTVDKWVENDVVNGDKRLLIIELENECVVEIVDMDYIVRLNDNSFEVRRLKTFGFIA